MKDIDAPYFEAIAKLINRKRVKWTISYHNFEDVENSKILLKKIRIDSKLTMFKKIEHLFSTQLALFH